MYSIVWFVCLYSGYRLFPRRKASLLTHAFVVTLYVAGFVFLGVLSDPWYRDAWCEAREKTVMSTMIFFTCVFNALHYFWNANSTCRGERAIPAAHGRVDDLWLHVALLGSIQGGVLADLFPARPCDLASYHCGRVVFDVPLVLL
eukprot:gnl/Hemi2/4267_TR1487_c0_g1_i2.p1 gnl/Hemi2/4267_TR1487_c0_g1~~gnl/Hemi2/4267_TR1487_c0_g1_i2.p1  ORF type:complete len:145 (+),score=6.56 gnl/Hemi2/4267_TR1487_c0_g1_i2:77-511(+)